MVWGGRGEKRPAAEKAGGGGKEEGQLERYPRLALPPAIGTFSSLICLPSPSSPHSSSPPSTLQTHAHAFCSIQQKALTAPALRWTFPRDGGAVKIPAELS